MGPPVGVVPSIGLGCVPVGFGFVAFAIFENNYTAIKNEFTWDMIIGQYEKYFVECHPATQFHLLQHKKKLLYKGQY